MRWKIDVWLWRAGVTALILSSLLSYLLVLRAFQGFQEDSMWGLYALLRVTSWVGLGSLLNWVVVKDKVQTHKGVVLFLVMLAAEEFWASFWKAWLYG